MKYFNIKNRSKIEWCDKTWNPTTGCTKIAKCADCMNCYAEKTALYLKRKGARAYKNGFAPTMHADRLTSPFFYDGPSIVFVNSMSDLFHPAFPLGFIQQVFETMNECPQHQFQILTKRPQRALELSGALKWTDNIWMGTSVGTNSRVSQIDFLRDIPAKIRFVSFEPLLTRLRDVNMEEIHWAILGGESPGIGGMRPVKMTDFTSLIEQCDNFGTAVFVKQLGGVLGKMLGMKTKEGWADKKGGDYSKFPKALQRREWPMDISDYIIAQDTVGALKSSNYD